MDVVAGIDLIARVDRVAGKEFDILVGDIGRQSIHSGDVVAETAAFGFLDPCLVIAVAVKDNALVGSQFPADQGIEIVVEVIGLFQLVGEPAQFLGHHGVEDDVGTGNGERGTYHAELKLVAGESHGRGAVAVGIVHGNGRHGVDADGQGALACIGVGGVVDDGIDDGAQFLAHENGNNSGRSLLSTQAVVIAGGGDCGAEHILVFVDALDEGGQKQQELGVFTGSGTGLEEIFAGVCAEGPVVMLAGAVHACEGLLVQQADQTVAVGHLFHHLHGDLVLVTCHVGVGENRRHLMLGGSHFIVLGLGQDAEFPEFIVQVLHIGLHAGTDRAVVVVLQLLAAGRFGADEGPAGHDQVFPLLVELFVDQEIFLLGAHLGDDALGSVVSEQAQDADSLFADCVHGAQKGHLFVQCMSRIGTEDRGDAQRLFLNKGEGCGIPCCVAAGLKGCPKAAGRERGGIGFAADQFLAGKLHDDSAAAGRLDKAVVFFGGDACHGLEPVCIVGRAFFDCPLFHRLRDFVGC